MSSIFTTALIIVYAILYGITMKIADLLDEHGMKSWFKGSTIFFGILWGIFGALLVVSNVYVANAILAVLLAYIFRMRIDYKNHAIATVIIIVTFLVSSTFIPLTFFVFLANFIVFGSIKDYLGDSKKSRGFWYKLFEYGWHFIIPPMIYAIFTTQWLVFYVFTAFIISYDLIKYIGEKKKFI